MSHRIPSPWTPTKDFTLRAFGHEVLLLLLLLLLLLYKWRKRPWWSDSEIYLSPLPPHPTLLLLFSDVLRGKPVAGGVEHALCVRMEASRALSTWTNRHAPLSMLADLDTEFRGLLLLLKAFKERYFDAERQVRGGGK